MKWLFNYPGEPNVIMAPDKRQEELGKSRRSEDESRHRNDSREGP